MSAPQNRISAAPPSMTKMGAPSTTAISSATNPGTSSGDAIQIMETLAKSELPSSMGFEWTELSYQQIQASDFQQTLKKGSLPPALVFPLAVLLVDLHVEHGVVAVVAAAHDLPGAALLAVGRG